MRKHHPIHSFVLSGLPVCWSGGRSCKKILFGHCVAAGNSNFFHLGSLCGIPMRTHGPTEVGKTIVHCWAYEQQTTEQISKPTTRDDRDYIELSRRNLDSNN